MAATGAVLVPGVKRLEAVPFAVNAGAELLAAGWFPVGLPPNEKEEGAEKPVAGFDGSVG